MTDLAFSKALPAGTVTSGGARKRTRLVGLHRNDEHDVVELGEWTYFSANLRK